MAKRLNNNIEENIENKKIKLENKLTEEDINNISNNYINYIQKLYDEYYKFNNNSNIILQKINMIKEFKDFIINNYKKIEQNSFNKINEYYYIFYYKFKELIQIIKSNINSYKYEYLIIELKNLVYSINYEEILNNWNYFKIIFIRLSLLYTFLYKKINIYKYDNREINFYLHIFYIS